MIAPGWAAPAALKNARHAQALLGPERWSQVLRIDNTARSTPYPREVFALVFELGGVLWFYTDTDGTQSLSLRVDTLEADKAALGPLLRAIDPGFVAHRVEPTDGAPVRRRRLPNGCLIECYAQLRQRVAAGEPITGARLLNLYFNDGGRRAGHTVLSYTTPDGAYVFDPLKPTFIRRLSMSLAAGALAVGRELHLPFVVLDARWVPTTLPAAAQFAARDAAPADTVAVAAPTAKTAVAMTPRWPHGTRTACKS